VNGDDESYKHNDHFLEKSEKKWEVKWVREFLGKWSLVQEIV